jgi:hypothetical protein
MTEESEITQVVLAASPGESKLETQNGSPRVLVRFDHLASRIVHTNHFCDCHAKPKRARIRRVKYWEIIADNLSKAGFSLGWVSAMDLQGRTIWIVDAHGYGKRFIVRADEILTAFVELQRTIHDFAVSLML